MSHIRIESSGKVAKDVKVFFVDGDSEVDISGCVQAVDVHLAVGEVVTATMKAIVGHARASAQIEEITVDRLKKSRWRKSRLVRAIYGAPAARRCNCRPGCPGEMEWT